MRTHEQEKAHQDAQALGLSHLEQWRGTHRGIPFSIKRHTGGGFSDNTHNIWCYYLYLTPDNFSKEDWEKILQPPYQIAISDRWYYSADALEVCDFQGGITWCDVSCQPCAPDKVRLEVGCDYNHLWDSERGYPYTLSDILFDAKTSIDKLHQNFTVYIWSSAAGTFRPEAECTAYTEKKLDELFPNRKKVTE